MPESLTHEEVLTLKPGERITIAGEGFDGSLWRRESTVTVPPVEHGYYYVGQQGTWALYPCPDLAAAGQMKPAVALPHRLRGKRRRLAMNITDAVRVFRGWDITLSTSTSTPEASE